MTARSVLLALVCAASSLFAAQANVEKPEFSFGLTTDIQYADKPDAIGRAYRASPAKLQECVDWWNQTRLLFVIQLGDFVDSGPLSNFDTISEVMSRIRVTVRNVLGNHDFFTDRNVVIKRLKMPAAYYQFLGMSLKPPLHRWQFVVLDGMNVSTEGGWEPSDPQTIVGRRMLADLTAAHAVNAQPWNGALGDDQREWLARTLAQANAHNEHAIVLCHFPALAASCRPAHLLWDHDEIVRILESSPSVAAYFAGHDHKGGYAVQNGIHYVTFPALVEHSPGEACKVVDVYPQRLVIRSLSGARQVLELKR